MSQSAPRQSASPLLSLADRSGKYPPDPTVDLPEGARGPVRLRDKVVLITGSTRGIGAATARLMAGLGARVAIHGRDQAQAQAAAAVLAENGCEARGYGADFADTGTAADLVHRVARDFGGIGILINNAGILSRAARPALDCEISEFETIMRVNVLAMHDASLTAVPYMDGHPGRILNISSTAADLNDLKKPGLYAYCASKAAVEDLVRVLCPEFSPRGVVIAALRAPGTRTDMVRNVPGLSDIVRPLADPADVARFICWAATAPAKQVHGIVTSYRTFAAGPGLKTA